MPVKKESAVPTTTYMYSSPVNITNFIIVIAATGCVQLEIGDEPAVQTNTVSSALGVCTQARTTVGPILTTGELAVTKAVNGGLYAAWTGNTSVTASTVKLNAQFGVTARTELDDLAGDDVAAYAGLDARRDFPRVHELAAQIAGVTPDSDPTELARIRAEYRARTEARARRAAEERARGEAKVPALWAELERRHLRGERYLADRGLDPATLRRRGDVVRF